MTRQIIQANETYTGIDYMKFFMALCVIMIHVISFFPDFMAGSAVIFIISLAVPFFFIASGFLLANKLENDNDFKIIFGYSKRIWRMYITWILIYIPLCVLGQYVMPKEGSLVRFIMVQARSVLLLGEIRFSYPTWYLYSLGLATMLIFLFKKLKYNMLMLVVAGILGILLQYLGPMVDLPKTAITIMHSLSRMSIGLGYVLFGMFIYSNRRMVSFTSSAILMVIAVVLYWADLPFAETMGSISVFMLMLMVGVSLHDKTSVWCRKQSLWIFLLHMYVLTPICLFGLIKNPWLVFLVCALVCISLSHCLILLSRSRHFGFLKKLT